MKQTKSAVLKKNRKVVVEYVEQPKLSSDECEIRITDAGLCSSDITRSYGNGAYFYPLVMGHELSGEIINLGSNINDEFSVGDKVCIFPLLPCFCCPSCKQNLFALCNNYDYYGSRRNGGFSEFLNVKKWNLLKLPIGVSSQDGALIEPTAVVIHAIKKLNINVQDKSSLCIFGAGFLGLIATQIVRNLYPNCEICLVDRNQFKLDIGLKYKANSKWIGDKKSWDLFLLDNENSFNHVIEFVGKPETFSAAIHVASENSNVVWAGNISGNLTLSRQQVSSILRKELTIIGTWNSIYKGKETCDWSESIDMIKNGLRPSELVSLIIDLEDVDLTLKKLYDHKNRKSTFNVIKVMVKPNKD
jgi:L-iditol 2-dehydrogenase